MRKFFIGLFTTFFFLLGPLTVAVAILYTFFSSSLVIKQALVYSGIYPVFAAAPQAQFAQALKTTPQLQPLVEAIKTELTADYLKNKLETFLDQTFAFARGTTQEAPVVNFIDLRDKLKARTPLFAKLPPETLKLFSQEIKIPQDQAQNIPSTYKSFRTANAVLIAASILLLLIIFVLGKDWPHRFRLIAKSFLVVGVPNLISVLILALFLPQVSNLKLPNLPPEAAFIEPVIGKFLAFFAQKFLTYSAVVFGIMVLVGIILVLVFKKTPKKVEKKS